MTTPPDTLLATPTLEQYLDLLKDNFSDGEYHQTDVGYSGAPFAALLAKRSAQSWGLGHVSGFTQRELRTWHGQLRDAPTLYVLFNACTPAPNRCWAQVERPPAHANIQLYHGIALDELPLVLPLGRTEKKGLERLVRQETIGYLPEERDFFVTQLVLFTGKKVCLYEYYHPRTSAGLDLNHINVREHGNAYEHRGHHV